jgi:hypothetical protein
MRRLSVAINFFGDPLVVYLAEPSTVSGLRMARLYGPNTAADAADAAATAGKSMQHSFRALKACR